MCQKHSPLLVIYVDIRVSNKDLFWDFKFAHWTDDVFLCKTKNISRIFCFGLGQKSILFEISPIKTKHKTENWFCLGTNITNDARNDWTLHLHPQRASMFSNERKFSFLDLSYPKPNRNEKSLKIPSFYTKIHHLSNVLKFFKLLLTLLQSQQISNISGRLL